MRSILTRLFFLFALVCNASAVTVETMDEQVNSRNLTVLRLRVNNESEKNIYDVSVRFFVQKQQGRLVVENYDLGGARVSLDSLDENIWAVKISIDSLPPGIFPYSSGLCLGIHDIDWQARDKNSDPSYIASSDFVINNKVELNLGGNHLPDAEPLVLFSGTKILLDEGDSVSFAWHSVPNAEKYRLRVFTADSQLIYQKETYGLRDAVLLGAGNYLWEVEAKNSTTEYGGAGAGGLINYLEIGYFNSVEILDSLSHGIKSVSGHKDTPMLVVGWGEYADLREWDKPHVGRTFLDENEAYSCWAIAIKNLNQFYGGNLSLDEIRWYVKKTTSDSINVFKFLGGNVGNIDDAQKGLKYALDSLADYSRKSSQKEPLAFADVKNCLKNDQDIYINMIWPSLNLQHIMLIDGYYATNEGNFVRCVNVDNLGGYGVFLMDSLFKYLNWYIIIDRPKTVRNMSPLLGVEKYENQVKTIEWTDSDKDGITDFDEVFRFGTNPYSSDSDSDKVYDKDEIYSYTILERALFDLKGSYVGETADLSQMLLIVGIESEYMSDVDGDGLRAEMDPDSDNDGILDGDDPEPYKVNAVDSLNENELPKEVVLYARKQLNVNDGTTCTDVLHTSCIYASEGTGSEYGMIMGARVAAANLYAKNNVFIRSNPDNTFAVNYYGSENLMTVRPDGKMSVERHFKTSEWPWKLNISLPSFDEGDSVLVVQRGDTCFLRNEVHLKRLKVESGGIVYLPDGRVYVGDLQLESGGRVGFENPLRNTILYVKGKILWRSNFSYRVKGSNFTFKSVAKKFKLIYYGSDKIFFDIDWYGTIMAPNAEIVLGQTHHKSLYGQFFANKIIVHQYADIQNEPYESDQDQLEYVLNEKN